MEYIKYTILLIAILFLICNSIKMVPMSTYYVIERLGVYHTTWQTGLHCKIPLLDRVAREVPAYEQTLKFRPELIVTKDNCILDIDIAVSFQIVDAKLYVYAVSAPKETLEKAATTVLRTSMGELNVGDILKSQTIVNTNICNELNQTTGKWGVSITNAQLEMQQIVEKFYQKESMDSLK